MRVAALAQPSATNPAAPAIDDGGRSFSHAGLAAAAASAARALEQGGTRRAGLRAGNGCGWAIADAALAAANCLSVPLPPTFTHAQLHHALDDAGLETLLTDEPGLPPTLGGDWQCDGLLPVAGLRVYRRTLRRPAPSLPAGTVKVTYTSGSTGTPKGVCLTRPTLDAVVTSLRAATAALELRRHLAILPLATLLENVAGLDASYASGGVCLLPPAARTGLGPAGVDVAALTRLITAEAPDSLILVPELLKALVQATEAGWQPPGSLRFVAVGGARVAPALLEHATALGLPVYEGYGLSECGSVLCLNTPTAQRRGTVGRPLPHVRLRVDDRGEIHVAAPAFAGYLGGGSPGAEYATGDLGAMDADGYVTIAGRLGNVIITSLGRNVSPEWVEGELLRHGAIAQACVAGEAQPALVALVVAQPGASPAAIAAAVASANAALPEYARVRRHAVLHEAFSSANGLLTANGRPRRARIHARYAASLAELHAAVATAPAGT